MSRYIDADEVEKLFRAGCGYAIWELPSIDIVFCKECKYYYDGHWCSEWEYLKKSPDDFCSYGERSRR